MEMLKCGMDFISAMALDAPMLSMSWMSARDSMGCMVSAVMSLPW